MDGLTDTVAYCAGLIHTVQLVRLLSNKDVKKEYVDCREKQFKQTYHESGGFCNFEAITLFRTITTPHAGLVYTTMQQVVEPCLKEEPNTSTRCRIARQALLQTLECIDAMLYPLSVL